MPVQKPFLSNTGPIKKMLAQVIGRLMDSISRTRGLLRGESAPPATRQLGAHGPTITGTGYWNKFMQ
ncbi:MAG TPA: hypothetical protein VFP47_16750 [Pyrinomonadaceae bacterium]|nr:hypothetical protein [Pyrinomonadaceae bacterium]